jgi:hypothetical protein
MLEESMNEPRIFNETWNHPNKNESNLWRMTIKKEFTDMTKRGVWELINKTSLLRERALIGNKWVFKQKKSGIY